MLRQALARAAEKQATKGQMFVSSKDNLVPGDAESLYLRPLELENENQGCSRTQQNHRISPGPLCSPFENCLPAQRVLPAPAQPHLNLLANHCSLTSSGGNLQNLCSS